MASATPVVGTPVGGFSDTVTDGRDGFVVDRDSADVASVIDRLVDSSDLLASAINAARATAESRTWDTVAAEPEQVYEEVVDHPDTHSDR